MTQLIRLDNRASLIGQVLRDNKKLLLASIASSISDRERLFANAFNAIAYNGDLLDVAGTKPGMLSIFGAVQETLKLGVEIGGALGESWLVPFNDRNVGAKVAVLILGYQGMRNIAGRSKQVLDLMAYPVFEGDDEFDFRYGDDPRVFHKPGRKNLKNKETLVACYAIAHLRGGGKQLLVMYREEIEEHRERSMAAKSARSPWNHPQDYISMARKTPVRGLFKLLPKNADVGRVLELEERADVGAQVFDLGELALPEGLKPDAPPVAAGGALDQLTDAERKRSNDLDREIEDRDRQGRK